MFNVCVVCSSNAIDRDRSSGRTSRFVVVGSFFDRKTDHRRPVSVPFPCRTKHCNAYCAVIVYVQ